MKDCWNDQGSLASCSYTDPCSIAELRDSWRQNDHLVAPGNLIMHGAEV